MTAKKRSKAKLGDALFYHGPCCALLPLALDRVRERDRTGLMRGFRFGPAPGGFGIHPSIIVRMHKSKDPKAELANVTLAEVAFCPFCGKRLINPEPYRRCSIELSKTKRTKAKP